LDSAAVWYGRFDGARWHGLTRVAMAQHAFLNVQFSSDLGVDGERLRFAFAFDKSAATGSNARGNQGVIMLRRDGGRWSADTLHSRWNTTYVQISKAAASGSWHLAIVRPYAGESGSGSSSLFLAAYDSAWGEPRLVVPGDSLPISEPSLTPLRDGLISTWRRRHVPVIEMARVPTPMSAPDVSTVFANTDDYGAVGLDSTTVLWHTAVSRDTVRALLYQEGRLVPAGTVVVNHDSDLRLAVPLSSREMILFTSRIRRAPAESPAITMVSRVTINCSPAL
jgi:hypothetical protein